MHEHITKRMSNLAKLSRGLDQSHPEYIRKPRHKLCRSLQKAIKQVQQLEHDYDEKLITLACLRDGVLSLLEIYTNAKDTQHPIDLEQLRLLTSDMLDILEPIEEIKP